LERYIRENLTIGQNFLFDSIPGGFIAFRGITMNGIQSAETLIDDPHNGAGSVSVGVSIEATWRLHRSPNSTLRLRVGESVPDYGSESRNLRKVVNQRIDGAVIVQLQVKWPDGDGLPAIDYENVEFASDAELRMHKARQRATLDVRRYPTK
jgi:hypothetical protein